ncbi:MAG: CxxxxCH/CxxCH domain-containing protein [Bacteroidales bacterium]|nr:CxxxxCH/CxxCH domain-containing protein [Bacteroidales bacterium]
MKRKEYQIYSLLVLILFLAAFSQITIAQTTTWPSAINSFSGDNTYCQNDGASNLSVGFSTCEDGTGLPENGAITVTWYSNTSNLTSGGTVVQTTISDAGTTTYIYTPSTVTDGILYYYVEISWTNTGNACGNNSPLSTSTYTTTTVAVTVNPATPSVPGLIFGSTTVPEATEGLEYDIIPVSGATTYTWGVPTLTAWSITAGQGTTSIIVTSGAAGENGDITVTAGNSCGTSGAATLGVTSETPIDHSLYGCNSCHMTHDALGASLTSTLGNSNLCLSCHVSTGAASSKPFVNADKADPQGGTGNSHAWDVLAINTTYETVIPTTYNEIAIRLPGVTDPEKTIICSACHDQHNSNANVNYTRISNAGDDMCKDCHSPRNVGRYVDNTSLNKGSHPVGLDYPVGNSDYTEPPTGSVTLPGAKIECSSCHMTHYATTDDGNLLRQTNDDALCTSCHTFGNHNGMGCNDCHQTHNTDKSNIYMIQDTITTPISGDRSVIFTDTIGTNSFADGDATYDGICEVCHTTNTKTYHYNTSAGDHTHEAGNNCTGCHTHDTEFATPACSDCHIANFSGWGTTDGHFAHTSKYSYTCNTCHFERGSGTDYHLFSDPLDVTDGVAEVNFDPNGLATRFGLDAAPAAWAPPSPPSYDISGAKTCENIYCHSSGQTATRGSDGTYNWASLTATDLSTRKEARTYTTTPIWQTGTITTCIPCHSGTGNMVDPYTITTPGLADPLPPATGEHQKSQHISNNQENVTNGWTVVNCFWCHNANNGDDGSPINQGTYGTSFHVDGTTYFDPRSVVSGGTILNNPTGGIFTYAFDGTKAHCAVGSKACW